MSWQEKLGPLKGKLISWPHHNFKNFLCKSLHEEDKKKCQASMEAHTWNPSIWEAKAGVTGVCGHRSLHSKFKISLDYTAGHCLKKKERERGKEGKGKTDTYIKTKYGVRIKFLMCSLAFCYCNKPAQITSSQGGKSHLLCGFRGFDLKQGSAPQLGTGWRGTGSLFGTSWQPGIRQRGRDWSGL